MKSHEDNLLSCMTQEFVMKKHSIFSQSEDENESQSLRSEFFCYSVQNCFIFTRTVNRK